MTKVSFRTRRRIVRLRRISRWWPWLASVALHVAVLAVLSVFVFVSYRTQAQRPEIVPEARLGKVTPGLPLFQQVRQDIDLPTDTNFERNLQDRIAPKAVDPVPSKGAAGGGNDVFRPIGMPSAGAGDGFLTAGGPRRTGSLTLPGGDLARMQPAAPVTRFFSSGGNAYSIVYLVDRSPSMFDLMDLLKRELKRSIADLQPMQKFHIIFFIGRTPTEGPAGTLTWATDRTKEAYGRFIDNLTSGESEGDTNPQPALQRALELHPDLIYILTDGDFGGLSESNGRKIADRMIQIAKANQTKINTINIGMETRGSLLRRIAEQTGGIYKLVSGEQWP